MQCWVWAPGEGKFGGFRARCSLSIQVTGKESRESGRVADNPRFHPVVFSSVKLVSFAMSAGGQLTSVDLACCS